LNLGDEFLGSPDQLGFQRLRNAGAELEELFPGLLALRQIVGVELLDEVADPLFVVLGREDAKGEDEERREAHQEES
jgi:hypothetical protein